MGIIGGIMIRFKDKETINTMLNIDNVFGDYEGHVLPIVITLLVAALPPIIWVFFFTRYLPIWPFLVADAIITLRVGLILIGKEKEKMAFYLEQRADVYKSARDLIHIKMVTDDGIIEYDNGTVGMIVSGYLRDYLTDDKLSVDLETFMNELDGNGWDWDFYLHNTVGDIKCQDDLPKLKRYTDPEIIRDRIDFYEYQDKWHETHSGLYRVSFLIYGSNYMWKRLQSFISELITSAIADVFNEVYICKKDEIVELFSRDIFGYVDIENMLLQKYDNSNYNDSKVLWYDDNIPEEYKKEVHVEDLSERRLS